MKNESTYQEDLAHVRQLMERSVKFISLSGLSGILAGAYALAGSVVAYYMLAPTEYPIGYDGIQQASQSSIGELMAIAASVFAASVLTGLLLSQRKAKKLGASIWNETSKRLAMNLAIPLVTGGLFILIMLYNGYYGIVAPACLLFYGLALVNASPNLYDEFRYLGYLEILLGLTCACFPGYGLFFWAGGFGFLHIIYGTLVHRRYDP